MKLVIFGLTVSSSWGNGHATIWRGLCRALGARGHEVVFFERDVPYYAAHRDLAQLPGGRLVLYPSFEQVRPLAAQELRGADAAMVTSYCPDALPASELVLSSRAQVRAFYDLDTPVTLDRLRAGLPVPYIGPHGLRDFDLVLSFTGGAAIGELASRLSARDVRVLYGSVDSGVHARVPATAAYRCDLSYLGTYAEDRHATFLELFVHPARRLPERKFLIGGAQYPQDFPWTQNTFFVQHLPPSEHSAFYSASRATLNVTRRAMAQMGFCPSGRLFEAAACATAIVSDAWQGLDQFFEPGREILVARSAQDVIDALSLEDRELARLGAAARERALSQHRADDRAQELERMLEAAAVRGRSAAPDLASAAGDQAEQHSIDRSEPQRC
jgi:spore maturation protein CgeB